MDKNYMNLNKTFYSTITWPALGKQNLPAKRSILNKTVKKEIHENRIWISWLKSTLRTKFSKVKFVVGSRFLNRMQPSWSVDIC